MHARAIRSVATTCPKARTPQLVYGQSRACPLLHRYVVHSHITILLAPSTKAASPASWTTRSDKARTSSTTKVGDRKARNIGHALWAADRESTAVICHRNRESERCFIGDHEFVLNLTVNWHSPEASMQHPMNANLRSAAGQSTSRWHRKNWNWNDTTLATANQAVCPFYLTLVVSVLARLRRRRMWMSDWQECVAGFELEAPGRVRPMPVDT